MLGSRCARVAAIAAGVATAAGATAASAVARPNGSITPVTESHAGATALARTMMVNKRLLLSGRFAALPPDHRPAAISTKPLPGFPRSGGAYAILTSGCSSLVTRPKLAGLPGCWDNGIPIRGTRDLTVLRVTFHVPRHANCLSFRFRFLSQEYPQFVGSNYNDGFIAELDRTNWDSGLNGRNDPHISAPRDFAKDPKGNIISVNATGPATMRKPYARGTTYGGATRILRASTHVGHGNHSLFLSIFDQGDRQYDSAVFIDQLTVNHRNQCRSGIAAAK